MPDELGSSRRGPFPALPALALMLIVSAVALQVQPLKSSRPHHDPLPKLGDKAAKRVRARLWQDPLQAVYTEHRERKEKDRKRAQAGVGDALGQIGRELEEIRKGLDRPGPAILPKKKDRPDWQFNLKMHKGNTPPTDTAQETDTSQRELPLQKAHTLTREAVSHAKNLVQSLFRRDNAIQFFGNIAEHAGSKAAKEAEEEGPYLLLSVLLHGGPYPEDAENRMRTRYAVLSALGQAGYKPRRSEHLQYFDLRESIHTSCGDNADSASVLRESKHDFLVPFERFDYSKIMPQRAGEYTPVLVLWIDEDALEDPNNIAYKCDTEFAWRLTRILALIEKESKDWFRSNFARERVGASICVARETIPEHVWPSISGKLRSLLETELENIFDSLPETKFEHRVIGPTGSEGLLKMRRAQRLRPPKPLDNMPLPFLEVYCPWATVADQVLKVIEQPQDDESHMCARPQDREKMDRGASSFISLCRTTATDGALMSSLLRELQLRGVSVQWSTVDAKSPASSSSKTHIAIIGEWDTLYGRARRCTLLNEIMGPGREEYDCRNHVLLGEDPSNVHFISYLRGLDGRLPDKETREEPGITSAQAQEDDVLREVPAGRAQLDYLRRLELQLHKLQEEHSGGEEGEKAENDERSELKAIGIIGSDVYDKLLILKALRPRFPGAVFFTTDLDARMVHPDEYKHTRNLIVASPYGLTLHNDLQRGIPPFRESYQTAMYVTTLYAIGDRVTRARLSTPFEPPDPRIYEIGRTGAYDLDVSDTRLIHPRSERDQVLDIWHAWVWKICVLLLCGVILVFPLIREALRPIREWASGDVKTLGQTISSAVRSTAKIVATVLLMDFGKFLAEIFPRRWLRIPVLTLFVAAFAAGLYFLVPIGVAAVDSRIGSLGITLSAAGQQFTEYFDHGNMEPLTIFEGISAWPTEFLRLAVCLLSIYFLYYSSRQLSVNRDALEEQYFESADRIHWRRTYFSRSWRVFRIQWRTLIRAQLRKFTMRLWRGVLRDRRKIIIHCRTRRRWRVGARRLWRVGKPKWRAILLRLGKNDEIVDVETIWAEYRRMGKPVYRLVRTVAFAGVYFWFGKTLLEVLGRPSRHIRGTLCYTIDPVLLYGSVALMLLLVFYVLDATKLCHLFIRKLSSKNTVWRNVSVSVPDRATSSNGPSDAQRDNLRKIRVIAERTDAVGLCSKLPFIVLFLMIVSRHSVFDNWDWPIGLVLIFVFAFAAVLCCGWLLRRSARRAQQVAVDMLRTERDALLRSSPELTLADPKVQHLTHPIEEIGAIRTGAFSPIGESPILGALLIPAGGIGLLELSAAMAQRFLSSGG